MFSGKEIVIREGKVIKPKALRLNLILLIPLNFLFSYITIRLGEGNDDRLVCLDPRFRLISCGELVDL